MTQELQKAIFGAGCFWHVQEEFDSLPGVKQTMVGFSGGNVEKPSYEKVCAGDTGHVEVVQITFDETEISYKELVKKFFEIHDPTQVNRQGPDVGEQYRSVIFYVNDAQKVMAQEVIDELQSSGMFSKPIATALEPMSEFYNAEEYHQHYMKKIKGE